MKSDSSIKSLTISAIKRKSMNIDSWLYSRVVVGTDTFDDFELDEDELPIFEIRSEFSTTLISTRHIFEQTNKDITIIDLKSIDEL